MVDTSSGIIGFIVGDALGVPVEFKSREELVKNPVVDMQGFGTHNQEAGTWSDDTSFMLATIDSLIECQKIDYVDIANKFSDIINYSKYTPNNEVFDIGRTCLKAIIKYQKLNINPIECGLDSEYSNGNGSLMRILPIIYFLYSKKDKEIKDAIIKTSSITHRHEISLMACYIYAKYTQFLLQGKDKFSSYKLLKELDYSDFKTETKEKYKRIFNNSILIEDVKSSGYVVDTLESVFYSILTTTNYKEAVLKAVNLGEDTDTVGALTGALAGIIYGVDSIPLDWKNMIKRKKIISKIVDIFTMTINDKNKKYMI